MKNLTIYVIGANSANMSLLSIKTLNKLYPELKNRIVYVDDNSVDNSIFLMKTNNIKCISTNIKNEELSKYNSVYIHSIRNALSINFSFKTNISECIMMA